MEVNEDSRLKIWQDLKHEKMQITTTLHYVARVSE